MFFFNLTNPNRSSLPHLSLLTELESQKILSHIDDAIIVYMYMISNDIICHEISCEFHGSVHVTLSALSELKSWMLQML